MRTGFSILALAVAIVAATPFSINAAEKKYGPGGKRY